MKNAEYDVLNGNDPTSVLSSTTRGIVEEFTKKCRPIERNMYVFVDAKAGAYYCECHMTAENLIKLCTIDVPLDPEVWKDVSLRTAAKEFVTLDQAQRDAVEEMAAQDNTVQTVWADKALTLSVMTAWAYVGGILQSNQVRLQNHYDLKIRNKGRDPLNAQEMAKGRHKSDPANYRGLGTRNDPKERGRCVELVYLQSESGRGITNALIDAAIKRHFTKQAKLEQLQAEKRVL